MKCSTGDIFLLNKRGSGDSFRGKKYLIVPAMYYKGQTERGRRERPVWMKPWLQRRSFLGQHDILMRESRGDFKSYLRMEPEKFCEILVRFAPRISKSKEGRPSLDPGLNALLGNYKLLPQPCL